MLHVLIEIIVTMIVGSNRPGAGVAGQQFPRPVLPPGVGAHACHPWLRQCLFLSYTGLAVPLM